MGREIGVIGAGTMGNGIAHVFARAEFDVVLYEVSREALDRGLATIRTNLDREAAAYGPLASRDPAWGCIRKAD